MSSHREVNKKRATDSEQCEYGKKKRIFGSTPRVECSLEIPSDTLLKAWTHYRSFLDSQEEDEPEYDYLLEIIELLQPFVSINTKEQELFEPDLSSVHSLLPAIISSSYLHLADHTISQGFDNYDDNNADLENPVNYLEKSLQYFPWNAAASSMLANYFRMNMLASLDEICTLYENAAAQSNMLRKIAIDKLNEEDDDNDEENELPHVKELVELLIIDGMVDCEFIGDENEEDENDEENREETIESSEEYSTSAVEATSSFMASLIHSTLQHHDKALQYLSKFDFTHRIHPNVWKAAIDKEFLDEKMSESAKHSDDNLSFIPKSFEGNGVLPNDLYEKMCKVFSPSAVFWKESNYHNRGYYSFFEDITDETKKEPKHLIDDVVLNYLLPRAQSAVPSAKIVGYEYWFHCRPLKANLGHQLHFDTDEALLGQEKSITHPCVSSVLYLTGNESQDKKTAGSTIVFNQTPDSSVATKAFVSYVHDRKYMIFPGECLHGVLPCPGGPSNSDTNPTDNSSKPIERLTFMVGFWTRRVPDRMKERKLYGPCSPLPEDNDENTWIREIKEGYGKSGVGDPKDIVDFEESFLPCISPAWEDISDIVECSQDAKLDVPNALDHRFYVKDASKCFRESLFRDEDTFDC